MHRLSPAVRRAALATPLAVAGWVLLGGGTAAAAPWPLAPNSTNAELITQLFWFTLVLAAVVFVLVEGLLIYSSLRFRRRAPLPVREPPQIHGNTRLEVMWAVVPGLILLGLFVISVDRLATLNQFPDNGMHIAVTGRQFTWDFAYSDAGGDVHSTNDLHIPVGTPIIADVTSVDVIHSFWIPELHGKIDANPGRTNHIWFEAREPGTFRGVCAELCGAGHAGMLFTVTAVAPDDFNTWLEQQRSGGGAAQANAGAGAVQQGQQLIAQKGCGACHTIPGVPGANGQVGPNLGPSGPGGPISQRSTLAGGAVPNSGPDSVKQWILNPPGLKPGTIMPNLGLTDAEATAIVAYLESLK